MSELRNTYLLKWLFIRIGSVIGQLCANCKKNTMGKNRVLRRFKNKGASSYFEHTKYDYYLGLIVSLWKFAHRSKVDKKISHLLFAVRKISALCSTAPFLPTNRQNTVIIIKKIRILYSPTIIHAQSRI